MSTASSGSVANPASVLESSEVQRFLNVAETALRGAAARAVGQWAMTLLEAQIPANQNDPANQKRERSLQRDLVKYFDALEDAIPEDAIARLYYSLVAQE